jgi:hypothetical protein
MHMQVYAAYAIRRDLAEAAKPPSLDIAAAAHLSSKDLQQRQHYDPLAAPFSSDGRQPINSGGSSSSGLSGQVPLEVPLMRQAIAWQLCYRELMHKQIRAAADKLKQELQAVEVRDLRVRMHVHSRTARMGYFPAYHLHYVHGEKYTPSRADIVPARYDALIGAADKQPRVGAELHPSPIKSQVRRHRD